MKLHLLILSIRTAVKPYNKGTIIMRIYNVLFAEIRDRLSVSVKNLRMGVKITHRFMTANYFDKNKKN
jgi:hypothetical protein